MGMITNTQVKSEVPEILIAGPNKLNKIQSHADRSFSLLLLLVGTNALPGLLVGAKQRTKWNEGIIT